jgi:hypothetical protein
VTYAFANPKHALFGFDQYGDSEHRRRGFHHCRCSIGIYRDRAGLTFLAHEIYVSDFSVSGESY